MTQQLSLLNTAYAGIIDSYFKTILSNILTC